MWIVNPETRRAVVHTPDSIREVKDGVLRTENPGIELPLSAIFE